MKLLLYCPSDNTNICTNEINSMYLFKGSPCDTKRNTLSEEQLFIA